MFSKLLYRTSYCLLVVALGWATAAFGQSMSVNSIPNEGMVQPLTASAILTPGSITDAMLANPYSGVGACAAHMWASTLTRNLAPTCTQPGFADLTGTATDAQLANAYSGVGACPAGQFASTLVRNAAPTCTAVPALAAGSVTDAMLANAYSGAGTCAANKFETADNRNAVPTCTQPVFSNLSGTATDAQLTSAYSGVGACGANQWASTLTRNAAPTCTQPAFTNISGTVPDTQLANAYSGIGTCTGGQFVSALVRNGAPTCTTPAGGGTITSISAGTGITLSPSPIIATGSVSLTTPVSIANGGTGSSTAAVTGNILVASSATVLAPVAMSGDCTIASSGAVTCTKSSGTALTGLFAPLTNPSGGQNNYAPLASPTFTGTVTMPDASTFTSAGHNNAKALGVGVAAPATTGQIAASNKLVLSLASTDDSIMLGNTAAQPYASIGGANDGQLHLLGGATLSGSSYIATPNANHAAALWQVGANSGGSGSNPGAQLYTATGTTAGSALTWTLNSVFNSSGLTLTTGETYQINNIPIQTTYYWSGGSTGTNYTTTATSGVLLDATKFQQAITVPTGYKLIAVFYGDVMNSTAGGQSVCIQWGRDGVVPFVDSYAGGAANNAWQMAVAARVYIGDGASHTYAVYFSACTGLGTAQVLNGGFGQPVAILQMVASS